MSHELLDNYDAAMVAFNAASAKLREARAAAKSARRELWAVHNPTRTGHPILQRS
jgi:hypothetical protein